jgi:Sortase domain
VTPDSVSTPSVATERRGASRPRWGRRAGLATLTAVVLSTGLAFGLVAGLNSPHRTRAALASDGARVSGSSANAEAPRSAALFGFAATSGSPGVSQIQASGALLIIPDLGIRAPLVPTGAVGAPETAALTIPADIHTVGWWDGTVQDGNRIIQEDAPAPGQPGVALIAGHVDSAAAGPGALHDLGTLQVGDLIQIKDSTGRISAWTVDAAPQTNLKTQLPPALWRSTGAPTLALVTCGGPFDSVTGHYLDNVIVWASQVN